MKTFRRFEYETSDDVPPELDDDVRMPESLAEALLADYTDPGDRVVDVFAGFGTTLSVAEELGRIPYGVEYEAERAAFIEERVERDDNVFHASALELGALDLPTLDCCLTSPPFMVRGMAVNPLQNYEGQSDYETYLDDLRRVFVELAESLAPGGRVLVDVSNMKYEGDVTPLAWDVARSLSDVLHFDGEIVIGWEGEGSAERNGNFGYGYDHSYVHVFTNLENDETEAK